MAHNHLEALIAEWYEYQGYFVRRNVLVGKRERGGYECELDVVAFHPGERRLVHLEPSLDANSWALREARFTKKFEAGRKYIPGLFAGMEIPATIEQYAVLAYATGTNISTLGGAKIVFASEIITQILSGLQGKRLAKAAVPEQFPLVRTLQYVVEFRSAAIRALSTEPKSSASGDPEIASLDHPSIGVILFDHDDGGYSAWLRAHPTGYVVNTPREVPPSYRMLHLSTCHTIQPGQRGSRDGALTAGQYVKYCADRFDALRQELGPFSAVCSKCKAPVSQDSRGVDV